MNLPVSPRERLKATNLLKCWRSWLEFIALSNVPNNWPNFEPSDLNRRTIDQIECYSFTNCVQGVNFTLYKFNAKERRFWMFMFLFSIELNIFPSQKEPKQISRQIKNIAFRFRVFLASDDFLGLSFFLQNWRKFSSKHNKPWLWFISLYIRNNTQLAGFSAPFL